MNDAMERTAAIFDDPRGAITAHEVGHVVCGVAVGRTDVSVHVDLRAAGGHCTAPLLDLGGDGVDRVRRWMTFLAGGMAAERLGGVCEMDVLKHGGGDLRALLDSAHRIHGMVVDDLVIETEIARAEARARDILIAQWPRVVVACEHVMRFAGVMDAIPSDWPTVEQEIEHGSGS